MKYEVDFWCLKTLSSYVVSWHYPLKDAGCRVKKRYSWRLLLLLWHLDYWEWMDMMYLQVTLETEISFCFVLKRKSFRNFQLFSCCLADLLTEILEAECFSSSFGGHTKDIYMILESYGASEMILHPNEFTLEKQNLRFKHLLEQKISSGTTYSSILGRHIDQEVCLIYPVVVEIPRVDCKSNLIWHEKWERSHWQ